MSLLLGMDGCKGGWFCASYDLVSGQVRTAVLPSVAALRDSVPTPLVAAIDIPIGLPDAGPRVCDQAARRLLGRPRGSSVFPAPIRPALQATSRAEADQIRRRVDGRGVPAQAFGLYAKIREVDDLLRQDAQARGYLFEVHPELSFMRWNGGVPIAASKKSQGGKEVRRVLVEQHFGGDALRAARQAFPRGLVADDDIHDAFAALWTAQRIQAGTAQVVPEVPAADSCGLPMAMWF